MRSLERTSRDQIVHNQRVSLLELLDRLLDKGVMVKGEILLSVADIDLVYLNLGLLLSSVKTVESAAGRERRRTAALISRQTSSPWEGGGGNGSLLEDGRENDEASATDSRGARQKESDDGETIARILPAAIADEIDRCFEPRANIDPKNVEKGLAKLVLTLVDLIRKLMEKQAIRRIEHQQLNTKEIETIGNAFLALDEKMEQLKKMFGLTDEDLNIDLGPLGDLL